MARLSSPSPRTRRLASVVGALVTLALIIGAFAYLTDYAITSRDEQIEACERGNVLRGSIRGLARDSNESRRVQRDFLNAAAQARLAAYLRSGNEEDRIAANQYDALAARVKISPLPPGPQDCEKLING